MLSSLNIRSWLVAGSVLLGIAALIYSCTQPESLGRPLAYQPTYELPAEIATLPTDKGQAQAYMEELTWQRFIAINWPAQGTVPAADTSMGLPTSNSYQATWNNFGLNYDLYQLPDSMFPVPLGDQTSLLKQRKARWSMQCPDVLAEGDKPLTYLVVDEFIEASLEPASAHFPVIDANGQYVRTTVLYNKVLHDFVQRNKLYTTSGLKDYLWSDAAKQYDSKTSHDTTFASYRIAVPDGAMMLKTSWKILGEGDDPSKFFTKEVVLAFENKNLDGPVEVSCQTATVGLVGMHFCMKTAAQQSWVWSTFEHVENVPDLMAQDVKDHYNFFEKPTLASSRGINKPPIPTDTTAKYTRNPYWFDPAAPNQVPTPIMREIPIADATQALNEKYQGILSNTVWKNYQLVGTQWAYEDNQFTPELLSNSTLESYEQPQASCMGCHNLLTGKGNNPFQTALGNTLDLNAPLISDLKTINDLVEKRTLHSDWMWSSFKVYPVGQLSWYQIRPGE